MNYVALDIGNVLVNVDFNVFLGALSRQLNLTLEEAEYFMNRTQMLHDLGLTKMADELKDYFKIKSPLIVADLITSWNNVISPCHRIILFFNELRQQYGLQIALLSNIGLEHAARLPQMLSCANFFNGLITHLSCQVGARKPSKLYYQSFLQQYPEFTGCSYLDDRPENLEASVQFGFRPFLFSLENQSDLSNQLSLIKQFILSKDDIV